VNPLGHAENHAPARNLELKARCGNLAHAARAALSLGAAPAGVLHQIDTYFHVPHGRLKLREISGKPGELIWYQRANSTGFRGSDYYVLPVIKFAETLAALTGALGVRGEVRKRRELYLWHNVRIHLDDVEGLGTFVEFEAVIDDRADEPVSHQRLATLTQALGITDANRIAVSYSDLAGL
jgi:adenylate cyclase class IV